MSLRAFLFCMIVSASILAGFVVAVLIFLRG
jgi:hypothetical protein